jgi:signal peptidase I
MFLSWIFPGLGQFYNGEISKGLGFLVLFGVINFFLGMSGKLPSVLMVQKFIYLMVSLWMAYDAHASATKLNGEEDNLFKIWGSRKIYVLIGAYFLLFIGLGAAALVIRENLIQAFNIPSGAMRSTLQEGDHLFVNKLYYKKFSPKIGDLIVFKFPTADRNSVHFGKDFIKRVVAIEGQTVQVKNKKLFVDSVEVDEPFTQHIDPQIYPASTIDPATFQSDWQNRKFEIAERNEIRDNFGPVVVPKANIFVMGDNRDRSFDSQFWGPLPLENIKGKAFLIYYPLNRWRRFT